MNYHAKSGAPSFKNGWVIAFLLQAMHGQAVSGPDGGSNKSIIQNWDERFYRLWAWRAAASLGQDNFWIFGHPVIKIHWPLTRSITRKLTGANQSQNRGVISIGTFSNFENKYWKQLFPIFFKGIYPPKHIFMTYHTLGNNQEYFFISKSKFIFSPGAHFLYQQELCSA